MTTTAPTYSVAIVGKPDVPVALRTDRTTLTLDASRIPHVDGAVTLTLTDAALLDHLDPRDSARLRITAGTRVFDLGIREVRPSRDRATVQVALSSDEALLADYAQLVDDGGARAHQASLRGVVNYGLAKIGAHLEPGADDADVTAYWEVQNQLANPSVEGVLAPWSSGGNCTLFLSTPTQPGNPGGIAACGFQSSAAGLLAVVPNELGKGPAVRPGRTYTLSAYGRRFGAQARSMFAVIRWLDAAGIPVAPDVEGTPVALTDTNWSARASITAIAPVRATRAEVFYRVSGSTAAGQIGYIDAAMFNEGELVPYFDGSKAIDTHYRYRWTGNAHASASTREPLHDAPDPDAFVWPAGKSALDFLHPLVQVAGFRLVCDERRRFTLRSESYRADGGQAFRHGINILRVDERLSRAAADWYDAAVFRYIWTDEAGIELTRVDAYSLYANPTRVLEREIRAPYPGPGRAEYAVRRAQGKGRTVTVSRQATWQETAEQPFSALLANTPIQTGIAERVEFDLASNEVTTTSRTTDTPANAIVLFPAGVKIANLVGKIADLNVGDYA